MKGSKKGKIEVIVLAAGASVRMGHQKLLKKLGGQTIIRRAVRTALAGQIGPVRVVVGCDAARISEELADLPVSLTENSRWREGQGTSVACGVNALADCEAVILMAADQPFLRPEHLRRLKEVYEEEFLAAEERRRRGEPREDCPPMVSSVKGLRGNPVLFPASYFDELKKLEGEQGARQLFSRYPVREVDQGEERLFLDVDTPEAFARAKAEWMLCGGFREAFPLLCKEEENAPFGSWAYLDSAATSQIADEVLAGMQAYERNFRANVHRGLYPLAERSDSLYEEARETAAAFFGVRPENTIFTHGATESLNLAIQGWGTANLKKGDLVLIDTGNHHANMVPWQILEKRMRIRLAFLPLTETGRLDRDAWCERLKQGPKAVSLTHVSNVTGREEDIRSLAAEAHEAGAVVIADCAQSAGHMPLSFSELDVDFAAVSAHKMYGPFGIGLLYAAPEVIGRMEPVFGGGGMIERVTTEGVRYAKGSARFEAGTPNVTGAVGFAAACRFVEEIGPENIRLHGRELCRMAEEELSRVEGVRLVGGRLSEDGGRCSLISFYLEGVHPHDAAAALAERGICVRAGHHCAMPLHEALGIPASIRVSFGVYSGREEVKRLVEGVKAAKEEFG